MSFVLSMHVQSATIHAYYMPLLRFIREERHVVSVCVNVEIVCDCGFNTIFPGELGLGVGEGGAGSEDKKSDVVTGLSCSMVRVTV